MKPRFPQHRISIFVIILNLFCVFTNISFSNVNSLYTSIPDRQISTNCIDFNTFPSIIQPIHSLCSSQIGPIANQFTPTNMSSLNINYFDLGLNKSEGCFDFYDDLYHCNAENVSFNTIPTNLTFNCDTLIVPEFINASISSCGSMAFICLPISFDAYNTLEIYDNGVLYSNGEAGCNMDTTVSYNYNNLFGQGGIGPYLLDSWTINGVEYSGEFPDIQSLLDSMNIWDTEGLWNLINFV